MYNLNNNTQPWSNRFFSQLENDLRELQNETGLSGEVPSEVQEGGSFLSNKQTQPFPNWRRQKALKALKEEESFKPSSTEQEFSLANLDQEAFQRNLKAYNEKVSAFAQAVLKKTLPELTTKENMCVVTTGSDGRQEKLCLSTSLTELMLVVNKKTDLEDPLVKKVQEVVSKYPKLFHQVVEVKCLEEEGLMYHHSNPYPTRALDAKYLAGSLGTMENYHKQFFQELKNENSASLLDHFSKGPRRDAFVLLKNVMDESKVHLDLEKGLLKYNTKDEKHKVQATKYPLLRTVQYGVALKLCKLVNRGKLDLETFSQLPKSTVERVEWLASRKLLKHKLQESKVAELKKAYTASLVWLELAQRASKNENKECVQVSQRELLQVVTTIDQLKDEFMG